MTPERRLRFGPGVTIAIGIFATVTLGVVGSAGWLLWVWSQTPESVRAGVSATKIGIVIATSCTCVALFFLGMIMTVVGLRHAFSIASTVGPEVRARFLGEAISTAMNWTAIGFLPLALGAIVVLVAGFRLIRAAHA